MELDDLDRDEMKPGDEAPQGEQAGAENICPECGGSGRVDDAKCRNCGGSGTVTEAVGGG